MLLRISLIIKFLERFLFSIFKINKQINDFVIFKILKFIRCCIKKPFNLKIILFNHLF